MAGEAVPSERRSIWLRHTLMAPAVGRSYWSKLHATATASVVPEQNRELGVPLTYSTRSVSSNPEAMCSDGTSVNSESPQKARLSSSAAATLRDPETGTTDSVLVQNSFVRGKISFSMKSIRAALRSVRRSSNAFVSKRIRMGLYLDASSSDVDVALLVSPPSCCSRRLRAMISNGCASYGTTWSGSVKKPVCDRCDRSSSSLTALRTAAFSGP
mmetsp:Transcript_3451/g.9824  ORF Transcript_3451/g.9824 Transcript_3451/m.9824 type:complete len:214 (+) Transcript_3451:910-1551(+)